VQVQLRRARAVQREQLLRTLARVAALHLAHARRRARHEGGALARQQPRQPAEGRRGAAEAGVAQQPSQYRAHRGEGVGARGGVGRRGGGGELEELRDAREIEVAQREAAVALGGGGVPPARGA